MNTLNNIFNPLQRNNIQTLNNNGTNNRWHHNRCNKWLLLLNMILNINKYNIKILIYNKVVLLNSNKEYLSRCPLNYLHNNTWILMPMPNNLLKFPLSYHHKLEVKRITNKLPIRCYLKILLSLNHQQNLQQEDYLLLQDKTKLLNQLPHKHWIPTVMQIFKNGRKRKQKHKK